MKHTDPQDLQTTERPVEKLLELADLIERTPGKYDQEHLCGTAFCIAGWWNYIHGNFQPDWEAAAHQMGLTPVDGTEWIELPVLFQNFTTIRKLKRKPTAADAAKVIRHFALTGEEDWGVAR